MFDPKLHDSRICEEGTHIMLNGFRLGMDASPCIITKGGFFMKFDTDKDGKIRCRATGTSMTWPFLKMNVGDIAFLSIPERSSYAQSVAHSYARTKGWRMKTERIGVATIPNRLIVTRLA